MAFRVKDAAAALRHALANGAKEYHNQVGPMELNIPAVYGIGSSLLYFVIVTVKARSMTLTLNSMITGRPAWQAMGLAWKC